jgi:hypothetical protein
MLLSNHATAVSANHLQSSRDTSRESEQRTRWLAPGVAAMLVSAPVSAVQPGALLTGSPWWVFPLFALLLYFGFQAAKPRVVSMARLLAVPLTFVTWGVLSLYARHSPVLQIDWLVTAGFGALLAAMTVSFAHVEFDRERGLARLPGSWAPLARYLAIFGAKYALGIASALHPEARDTFALWDIAVSGASAGYFMLSMVRLIAAYRRAGTTGSSTCEGRSGEQCTVLTAR